MTGVVIHDARRQRMPDRARLAELDEKLRHVPHLRAERVRALAHCGSSANSSPYSFIADPHPAALTTMRSTPAASKTSMLCRASARAWSMCPACSGSAPQQPCRPGACDVASFGRQHADRRLVDVGEREPLHAAGEQRDLQPLRSDRGRVRRAVDRTSARPGHRRRQGQGRSCSGASRPPAGRRQAVLRPASARGLEPPGESGASNGPNTSSGSSASRIRHGYGTTAMSSDAEEPISRRPRR